MVLSFNQYAGYLYGIGGGILLVIALGYYLIIWRHSNLFYKLLRLMFHIEVYDPNEEGENKKTYSVTTTGDTATTPAKTTSTVVQAFEQTQPPSSMRMPTVAATSAPKKYLDLYGKYIHAETFLNRFILAIIVITLWFIAAIAFYQGVFLVTITIYPGQPCSSNFIQMDCYFGSQQTYFNCTQGQPTDVQFVNGSAMCFRWIVQDVSVNDVMTQLGACVGLLHAFLAITQALLRYLIYCSEKCEATDDKNTALKPAQTQIVETEAASQTAEEQEKKQITSKNVYKREWLHNLNIFILVVLILIVLGGAVALGYFKISTTVLTYVILVTIVILACIAFIWVTRIDAVEHDLMKKNDGQSLKEVVGDSGELKEAGNTIYSFLNCCKNN